MKTHTTRRALLAATAGLALSLGFLPAQSIGQDTVTLTFLVDNRPHAVSLAEGLVADFEAANPGIKIEIETRGADAEGDNLVRTRLATEEMTDIFFYNSGSLFQALNPERTLVDLTDEPFQANVLDSFKSVVTVGGRLYGAPMDTAMGGGVLYNKAIYADLGLSVPMS